MALFYSKRLSASVIAAARAALISLKDLLDYAPPNRALSLNAIMELEARLRLTEEAEGRATNVLAAARDARDAAGYALQHAMLDVKAAVRSQYGANSDALQSLGIKKRLDYRRPVRQPKTKPTS